MRRIMTSEIQAMSSMQNAAPAKDWRQRPLIRGVVFLLCGWLSGVSHAVDFPTLPLQTGVVQPAPNVIFILDDSTSMEDDTLDTGLSWSSSTPSLGSGTGAPYTKNPLSYNPHITYQPWASANNTNTDVVRLGNANYNNAYNSVEFATSGNRTNLSNSTQTFYVPKSAASVHSDPKQYYRYQ